MESVQLPGAGSVGYIGEGDGELGLGFVQLPGIGAVGVVEGDGELGLGFVQLPGAGAQVAPGGQSDCGDRATRALRLGALWNAVAAI